MLRVITESQWVYFMVFLKVYLCVCVCERERENYPRIITKYSSLTSPLICCETFIEQYDYFCLQVPVPFLIMLLIQFIFIVIDRALYLKKNVLGKFIFQIILVVVIHVWMFFILPYTTNRYQCCLCHYEKPAYSNILKISPPKTESFQKKF